MYVANIVLKKDSKLLVRLVEFKNIEFDLPIVLCHAFKAKELPVHKILHTYCVRKIV